MSRNVRKGHDNEPKTGEPYGPKRPKCYEGKKVTLVPCFLRSLRGGDGAMRVWLGRLLGPMRLNLLSSKSSDSRGSRSQCRLAYHSRFSRTVAPRVVEGWNICDTEVNVLSQLGSPIFASASTSTSLMLCLIQGDTHQTLQRRTAAQLACTRKIVVAGSKYTVSESAFPK